MAPRTGGDPLVGEDKINTSSAEFTELVRLHKTGDVKEMTPSQFYELNEEYQKFTLKAVQNAWANSKKQAAKEITGMFCLYVL
jgi:hypothetical protein